MPPAGAAERHGQVRLALAAIARQQRQQQVGDTLEGGREHRVGQDMLGDGGILAGQRAQREVPVRVTEEAHVEDQVGIARQAAGEAEGQQGQRQRIAALGAEALSD